jgi:hypothetical protein
MSRRRRLGSATVPLGQLQGACRRERVSAPGAGLDGRRFLVMPLRDVRGDHRSKKRSARLPGGEAGCAVLAKSEPGEKGRFSDFQ